MSEIKTLFDNMNTRLQGNPGSVAGMKCVYQFKVTGDDGGEYYADLTGDTPVVAAGTKDPANCTITVAAADLLAITTGKLSGQMAFMTGKLKISGDMGLAMKLQKILG